MSAILTDSVFTPALKPAAESPAARWRLGKYREIIIAVAFFLLFDLGVLVLNFYTSFQIGQDAVGINLAGRQRMLSQRTAKALFSLQAATQQGTSAAADLDELRQAVKLFDATLTGFRDGATVPGGNGKPVALPAAEGPEAERILNAAAAIWGPYQQQLAPVLGGSPSPDQLQAAVAFAKANNLPLLKLMNELTTALEAVAGQRASTLRRVQTGGIVLALLNFAFILFKFLRRLQSSDAAVEAATEETREILSSVREGLFLINADLRLGTQLSRSTAELFGRPLAPGDDFLGILAPLVSAKDLEDARGYVDLLFQPHVKEALIQSINPLAEVALTVKNRLGQEGQRHLSFQFNRAMVDGVVRHLLVTVQDVSARVALEAQLQQDRERSHQEFALLLAAMAADPATLRQFVLRSEAGLLEVNDLLRSTSSATTEARILKAIDAAARRVHALKGDAAMLGLDTLAHQAHEFENELERIRNTGGSAGALGESMLSLPMLLEALLHKISALKTITRRHANAPIEAQQAAVAHPTDRTDTAVAPPVSTAPAPTMAQDADPDAAAGSLTASVNRLVQQMAEDLGKRVEGQVALERLGELPAATQDLVREITVQLTRNAVVHGVETPSEREAQGKPAQGLVAVQLQKQDDGWHLSVRDDGQGISPARVRARLLSLGWYNAEQLESFSERQIVEQIFKPGFSTATEVSVHAGRGAGLDVVGANVRRLGARVRLTSTPGACTEFRLRFDA